MIDIIHRVGIRARPSRVYAALSTIEGVAGWWTKETSGVSKPGGTIDFQFSSPSGERIGGMTMEVLGLDPDKEVHWRCNAGPEEWIGTDVVFKLTQDGDYTIVHLRSQELARGGRVHRTLQHEVGNIHAESQRPRRKGQRQALARRHQDRQLELGAHHETTTIERTLNRPVASRERGWLSARRCWRARRS